MTGFTLHELQCFEAVVRGGGFQAAAQLLHRSHASVFAAVAKLEDQLGLTLLDRAGYRVQLTQVGESFLREAGGLLRQAQQLRTHAAHLAMGEEAVLRVVLGDLCPLGPVLGLLGRFFGQCPQTRLHLEFEAVTGPWERLRHGNADLIVHRVPASDTHLECLDLGQVALLPVVAPGFLPFPATPDIAPRQLERLMQCVVRDSAQEPSPQGHYLIEGAPYFSVPDHFMKKELILRGMAWGHLPRFMIDSELRDRRLLSIAGRHFPGIVETLAAARRRDRPHGLVADRLWTFLADNAPVLDPAIAEA